MLCSRQSARLLPAASLACSVRIFIGEERKRIEYCLLLSLHLRPYVVHVRMRVDTRDCLRLEEVYKWKNHFYEMKGDVGMSLHEKERNKMPTPRHKVAHNPIPTSLFFLTYCLFVCYECIRQSKQHNILTSNCLHENVRCSLGRNKDVGMGL